MELDQRLPYVNYNFTKEYQTNFGEAVYLSGSLPELGKWDLSKAIRMKCLHQKYWASTIFIPIELDIQYKFFIGPFDFKSSDTKQRIRWLGNRNQHIKVSYFLRDKFQKADQSSLSVMSFNLRYENSKDTKEESWQHRKINCTLLILEHLPDVLGIQQGRQNQIDYLISQIGHFYNYYGKARDLKQSQHSGIFIRKDKFFAREDGYIWINETKTPGKNGFGANLPRYYTYLVLEQIGKENNLIMCINTHLDHQSSRARHEGIKCISSTIQQKMDRYGQSLGDVFVTGDFNCNDTDPIFQSFLVKQGKIQSLRYILPKKESDLEQTFNGFKPTIMSVYGFFSKSAIIDHIFVKLKNYEPCKFSVLREKIVSDHYPAIGYFNKTQ